ncbi:hypothetical protein D3C78_1335560 [compost metagenome]
MFLDENTLSSGSVVVNSSELSLESTWPFNFQMPCFAVTAVITIAWSLKVAGVLSKGSPETLVSRSSPVSVMDGRIDEKTWRHVLISVSVLAAQAAAVGISTTPCPGCLFLKVTHSASCLESGVCTAFVVSNQPR